MLTNVRAGTPALCWIVSALAALASEGPSARMVSLDEVLKLARERAQAIAVARARVAQARRLLAGVKALFVFLTLLWHSSLWSVIAADMGASLLVIANGLRLLKATP
ncbi:MAG: hypothetical protein U0166_01090 [Acidobacteriota bacterium]